MALSRKTFAFASLVLASALGAACSSSSDDASGTPNPGGGQGGASAGIVEARSDKAFDTKAAPAAAAYGAVVAGVSDLGFDLERKLGEEGNFIFSPVSTATALSMTYAGARGQTAKQMGSALHDSLGQDAWAAAFNKLVVDLGSRDVAEHDTDYGKMSLTLRLVDSAFVQNGYALEPAFLDTLSVHYDAGVKLLEFASDPETSRLAINGWVEDQTKQKIKDLIPPGDIDGDTKLVLVNALYFHGSWATPFAKDLTASAPFHAPGGDVAVDTMHLTGGLPYIERDGYKLTQLGYDGGKVAMTIVLPDTGKIADVEGALSSAWLDDASQALAASGTMHQVAVALPKFKFTWGTKELSDALKALGMTDAFANPPADFSGIEPKKDLYISHVLHKAYVGVDEDGTEAAAATAVVMRDGAAQDPPKDFTIDRPFLFFVRDLGSGAVLFSGKVVDPTR
jgi:serpin B